MKFAQTEFNQALLDFLRASPTPFHAARALSERLDRAGFRPLREGDAWALDRPGRYYVVRGGSSVVACTLGRQPLEAGLRMVGAHTDSPCLRVKPHPEVVRHSLLQLGVEVYGGPLLNPWFDRDLSLAGRVSYLAADGKVRSALIDFARPVAVIPSLAIHFDREVNQNRSINAQNHLPPLLMQVEEGTKPELRSLLLEQLKLQHPDAQRVLDYELNLYDCQPPALVGLNNEFIASARLDNLLSCFIGLSAILEAGEETNCVLACLDHEEIGSTSALGAYGTFLQAVLERLAGSTESLRRACDRALFISADNAHGVHPNYADKHDPNHASLLNHGPVIKTHAGQRYASTSETAALFRLLCEQEGVPVQTFASRSDLLCGTTIGPITASRLGVRTLDVGAPTLAMHSIRELAGTRDAHLFYRALGAFYTRPDLGLEG